MKFVIIGDNQEKKVVALFDKKNGGVAIATPYTVKQLINLGHEVIGVDNVKPFHYHCCNRSGKPTKRPETLDGIVPTKRAASTFIKGIKPTKAAKPAAKTVVQEHKTTAKPKQREITPQMDVFQKDKLLALKKEANITATEYQSNTQETYVFYAASPAAFETLKTVLKTTKSGVEADHLIRHSSEWFLHHGSVAVETSVFKGTLRQFQPRMQLGFASKFALYSNNHHEGTFSRGMFVRNDVSLQYECTGYRPSYVKSLSDVWVGSSAGGMTLADYLDDINSSKTVVSANGILMDIAANIASAI